MAGTATVGLLVTLEAKPGRERDVEEFLDSGLPLVDDEPATTAWFALHLGGSRYGIFDVFPDDAGRDAHLSGKVAEALVAKAPELFAAGPDIRKVDVRAAKLP
ncbi:putative quinol monooxygenase [Prauserella cavernicola]|uniref:Antibiotic biosynthesis monooxygenase n=1 Tax=Prauserella cavernicola TaxID=2800127 RepID=A0A934QS04_9PSEU|nr:antibiotic biosynthesis monooxygenase [Prauserella cavernicola]MBK1785222.1 antibiotic biosynthesis monooxygenase [Prauserella cavernicola]